MAQLFGKPASEFGQHAYWMVPLAAPTIVLTIVLLALGEWGADLAQVIGLPFVIYGAASTIFARRELTAHHEPFDTRRKAAIGAVTLLVGAVLPALGWLWYARYTDVDVSLEKPFRITEQTPVTVVAKPERSGWRGELTFTARLASVRSLGDCVLPARLTITPVADGQHLPVVRAVHGAETTIAIPDGASDVRLDITLVVPPDQGCDLAVTLARPVLHRTPW
jgi:hypothetical protein